MNIDIITQYILAIVPAFTAVVGMVVTLGVGIGKIKKANKETTDKVEEVSSDSRALKKQLKEISKENAELKEHLNKITARMEHMYFIENENVNKKSKKEE